MVQWTNNHKDNYPLAKTIKPVHFRHGPYFNECVERVPKLFTDATCYYIVEGTVLQVLSYDPELKYIRMEFLPEIRELIKPGIPINDPCRPMRADYVIYVPPEEIDTQIEILGNLE